MKKAAIIAAAAAYACAGAATFGMVWNRIDCDDTRPQFITCEEQRAVPSVISAMFWPFAVSVILQEERK